MNRKKLIYVLMGMLALAACITGIYQLHETRLWPFSTGTQEEAFLGSTFGMSPQEVRRALKKQNAQLLAYEEYRKTETLPLIKQDIFFAPLFSEDIRKESYLYMPSIEMYNCIVEAEFTFRENRLSYVAVYFDPIDSAKSQSAVESIEKNLKSFCEFSGREESKDVPGAYTVHFTSQSSELSLWVNITGTRPIIILNLLNPKTESDKQEQILRREQTAFGSKLNDGTR